MSGRRWTLFETLWIGPPDDRYLIRHRIVATPMFGVYVHRIIRADAERDVHDHPWPFATLILRGGYVVLAGCRFTEAGDCVVHGEAPCPDCGCGTTLHWAPE